MSNHKLLSALSYFSVFFLPLLLPFVIYVVSEEQEVKRHAKRALISHLIPVIILVTGFILFSLSLFSIDNQLANIMNGGFNFWRIAPFIFTFLYSLLFLIILIWNVYQGVRVLK